MGIFHAYGRSIWYFCITSSWTSSMFSWTCLEMSFTIAKPCPLLYVQLLLLEHWSDAISSYAGVILQLWLFHKLPPLFLLRTSWPNGNKILQYTKKTIMGFYFVLLLLRAVSSYSSAIPWISKYTTRYIWTPPCPCPYRKTDMAVG